MNKKLLLTILVAIFAIISTNASVTWSLQGTEYSVDTLFYNQVGPGTTTTSLWYRNASTGDALRVFYCTMDMTNPYLSLAGVCATDKLAGNEKVSTMATRKSAPGKRYFVGVNADFFTTSGVTHRNVSKVGSPVGSTVVDGEIFRARNNATLYKNFIVDKQGQVYVNPFTFAGTVTNAAGTSATMGGINVTSITNKLTLYTDKYYGGTDEIGTGTEIQVKVVDGEQFETAKEFHMVCISDTSTAGDMDIPTGAYVLHGRGTAGTWVKGLQKGDTLSVKLSWTYGGVSVEPQQIISGNPKILADGETLQSEGDRSDANSRQPRAAVGYSDGGKKVYFFVVDGRSPISSGVRTTWLADIMRYAGVTDGMNVDGGGSACLYTSTLGIRNVPSDGSERSDGNGFFVVSSAPDDNNIASIRFVDFSLKSPRYGVYTPKFYGYNQYGMLVSTDVKGVKLSCPEVLGHIIGDTTFYADGTSLCDELTATYNGATVSVPVTITNSVDAISITNDTIITDTYKDYAVAVQTMIGETAMSISPRALNWKSTDESVVTIEENTGILRGVKDGTASVIGTLGDVCDTMVVIVEKPTAHVMPIDPNLDVTTWKTSQTGGSNVVVTANGNGLDYTYTGASGRAPKIVLTKAIQLWSLPDTIRLRVNPGEAPVKNFQFGIRPKGGSMTYQTITPASITANQEMTIDLPVSSFCDATDMGNYPLTLNSVQINMNTSTTGTVYNMHFTGFETVYTAVPADAGVKGDVDGNGKVDTSDLSTLMGIILANGTATDYPKADVNGDGQVNTSDISVLVTIILSAS